MPEKQPPLAQQPPPLAPKAGWPEASSVISA